MKRTIAMFGAAVLLGSAMSAHAVSVIVPPASEVESSAAQFNDDSYYDDVVTNDDGSFAETPAIAAATPAAFTATARRIGDTVRFAATGLDTGSTFSVLVFDATGRTMFSSASRDGGAVEWNLHDLHGVRASRGVYLYRAFAQSSDGRVRTMEPGRVIVQ